MDINNHNASYFNKLVTNNSSAAYWDLQTAAMEQHNNFLHPHPQIPSSTDHSSLWPNNYPNLHHHHHQTLSSSSSSTSSSTLLMITDHEPRVLLGDHHHEEDQDHQDDHEDPEEEAEELGALKEMMYKIAAMQPVDIDPATIRKPKRRNVRISDDPQSVAARHRRERISDRIRILQRLVPGGTKMDTASMLDEAIRYVKFLKRQIRLLQSNDHQQQQQQQEGLELISSTSTNTTTTHPSLASGDNWGSAHSQYGSGIRAPLAGFGTFPGGGGGGGSSSGGLLGEACFNMGFNHDQVISE